MIRYSRHAEETPRERRERRIKAAMFWFGLLFLVTMVHGARKMIQPFLTLPTTQARVVSVYRVRDDYTELEYEVDGESYSKRIDDNSIFIREGKQTPIAYDPDQPDKIYTLMQAKTHLFAGSLGLFLFLGSGYPQRAIRALLQKKKTRRGAWPEEEAEDRATTPGFSDPWAEERARRRFLLKRRLIGYSICLLILVLYLPHHAAKKRELQELPSVEALVVEARNGGFRSSLDKCKVEYTVDGQQYSHEFGKYYRKGSRITIYYESENPKKAYLPPDSNGTVFLGLFGVGLLAFSVWRKYRS